MTLSTMLSLLSTMAFIAGGVFAGVQIRQLIRQRAREYALQLLHSYQTPEFQHAVNIVVELPEGLSKKEIEERLGDRITAVLVMFGTFEALGVLICRKEIEIDLVEDFFSGVIVLAWKKFRNYIFELREAGNRQTYYEWFQWTSELIERRESVTPAVPAYIAHRYWKE